MISTIENEIPVNFHSRGGSGSMPVINAHSPSRPTSKQTLYKMLFSSSCFPFSWQYFFLPGQPETKDLLKLNKKISLSFQIPREYWNFTNKITLISMNPSALISPVIQKPLYSSGLSIPGVWKITSILNQKFYIILSSVQWTLFTSASARLRPCMPRLIADRVFPHPPITIWISLAKLKRYEYMFW